MPFKVTFLEGTKPLTKTIKAATQENYPLVKDFTSHSYLINSLKEFEKHMQVHAAKGDCVSKGPITTEIVKESRAGLFLNSTPTNWFVLDIDSASFTTKTSGLTKKDLTHLTEQIIKTLPSFLHTCSYIVQASSSLGFIADKVSLHLFFLLDTPLPPSSLKRWITNLNFELDAYKDNLELTKTGWDVKYTLDRCVADNARLIYIAPPKIQGKTNPFVSDSERICLVTKKHGEVAARLVLDGAGRNFAVIKKETITRLRKEQGLESRSRAKYQNLLVDGNKTAVLLNPTPGSLDFEYQGRGYCYYNLNGGNSNGYYHPIGKPDLIYNFKDEPVFRWVDVDPTTYEQYVLTHELEIKKANPEKHFAVISKQNDVIYKVTHNLDTEELRISQSDIGKIGHFYREHGDIMPETINEWDVVFDPQSLTRVNYEQRIVNEYAPSEYIQKATEPKIAPELKDLQLMCPTIHKVLLHVLGNGQEEYLHFLNWLGYILQAKEKTNTCWFLWGTQGTGKGLLFNYVLSPMIGKKNVAFHLGSAIEDNFDGWRKNKQLVVIDEFELPQGKKGDRIMERIKNWTAEANSSVRDMQKVSVNMDSIEAYIFFSNKHSMITIDDGERRFNIAPRQEIKIEKMPWFDSEQIVDLLTSEVQNFTNFILSIEANAFLARQALDNDAKHMAADATKTMADNFCSALHNRDLNFFLDLLYLTAADAGIDINMQLELKSAQIEIRKWLQITSTTPGTAVMVTPPQVASVYRAITCTKELSPPAVSKMLARHGLHTKPSSYNGRKGRYLKITFNPPALTPKECAILLKAAPGTQIANILGTKTA